MLKYLLKGILLISTSLLITGCLTAKSVSISNNVIKKDDDINKVYKETNSTIMVENDITQKNVDENIIDNGASPNGDIVNNIENGDNKEELILNEYEEENIHNIIIEKLNLGDIVYNFDEESINIVQNPSSKYVLVNKYNELPSNFVPENLVVPNVPFSFSGENEKKYMNKEAAIALEELFTGAKEANLELYAVSGYRSYNRQKVIYNYNVSTKGEEAANLVSAKPGQSEHQTGLAMDVSSREVGFDLVESFGETEEGKWLVENSYLYGFIIRYPKDKTEITKYSYEPWHLRFVGKDLAKYLYENKLTLEEFYEQVSKNKD